MFPWEFCKTFKYFFLQEHLWTTTSAVLSLFFYATLHYLNRWYISIRKDVRIHRTKNEVFPLRISSVNVKEILNRKLHFLCSETSCNGLNKNVTKTSTILVNPLSANPTKWPNALKQFVGNLPTNCLSVFDNFVGLALKGLILEAKFGDDPIAVMHH